MIEYRKYLLCDDPVRNVTEGGKTIGFCLKLNHESYKGIRLSYLTDIVVILDGAEYRLRDASVTFTIGSGSFTAAEMTTMAWHRWNFCEKAELFVPLEGGITPGRHHIAAAYSCRDMHGGQGKYLGGQRDIVMGECEEAAVC